MADIEIRNVVVGAGSAVAPWVVGGHTVYTKSAWTGDWVAQFDLHCEEAVWCAAPSVGTATLVWHYGRIAPTGAVGFGEVLRRTGANRLYVRVEFAMQLTFSDPPLYATRNWYGVIEVDEDLLLGEEIEPTGNRLATGEQTLTAFDFGHVLDQIFVNRAWWDSDGEGEIKPIARAVAFNHNARKNRSTEQAGDETHLTYHFAKNRDEAEWWSSRDIVEYLVRYFRPKNQYDESAIDVQLDYRGMEAAIPAWDHPEIDPTNRSLWSLLCSLIPRQRLASFYVGLAAGPEEGDPDHLAIRPFTFVDEPVATTEQGEPIPANVSQIHVYAAQDPSGEASVKTSTVERYDQVIARGRRRRSVFTVSYADGTLEPGWTTELEEEYEQGASEATGYDTADLEEQRRMNADARVRQKLRAVFSRFQIPDTWDGYVRDGLGEGHSAAFPDDADPPEVVAQYWPALVVEKAMPLLEDVDYSEDKIEDDFLDEGKGTQSELAPLVFWKEPASGRYCHVERFSKDTPLLDDAEEWHWSASVVVSDDDRAIRLIVSGAPQHVLDFPGFSGLPNVDKPLGEHDWRDAIVTLSIEDDRYAEGRYPADDEIPAGDYVQRLWVEAEGCRVDYVVPDTVVDVDDAGALVRSDGGYLHDDRDKLAAIAKIAYLFYSRDRRVLALATDQLTTEVELGDYVAAINQADADGVGSHYFAIETPITEIRITTAMGTTDAPPIAPRMRLVTDCGQLDALALISPAPMAVLGSKGQVSSDATYTIHWSAGGPPAGALTVPSGGSK